MTTHRNLLRRASSSNLPPRVTTGSVRTRDTGTTAQPSAPKSSPSQARPQARPATLTPNPANVAPNNYSPPETASSQTEQSAPAEQSGQWVYTDQYGWVWIPYAREYTYVASEGYPYSYVYYPSYGWMWLYSPWVFGWGPGPYWGIYGPGYYACTPTHGLRGRAFTPEGVTTVASARVSTIAAGRIAAARLFAAGLITAARLFAAGPITAAQLFVAVAAIVRLRASAAVASAAVAASEVVGASTAEASTVVAATCIASGLRILIAPAAPSML